MLKKLYCLIGLSILLVLSSCSITTGQNGESTFPNKPIDLIVSYAAGGGTDTGARILQPYLEEELGVTVNVVNKPGGAGWVGWTELANAKPDGYTIGYINSPNIITGYLDPKFNRDESLESFQLIANHVLDPGVIAIRPDDDRFSNINEVVKYAQDHKLTATTSGVGSNDHMAILKLNKFYNTKITPVHTKGAAKGAAQVLGEHIDLFIAKVGEVANRHNNGELKAVAVMTEERSPFLEEVPTMEETGYPEVSSRSARGIAAPAGLSKEKLEILNSALKKAIEHKEQVEKMEAQGLQIKYLGPEGFQKMLEEDENSVKGLSDLLGY
ncbi:tripartite tricarboxylate transporter substrate binding protein [Halobacillus naozhouensis]|uniref:Tripartite tricarboxylate transporter substrate binding protein n=1 Tax=Halobacillus naozhouensis TaxID=554880 RepID=A0ABY8J3X8_9BACI|nr:tripartite tricarboxylate transporter substrate binding protein [Halobacillus naozhouensis]WFT75656.1 tripartite tricarboxylate transporter substrate binding protein [Halobacillus naozhouensis]